MGTPDQRERLEGLFERHSLRVLAYAQRHVGASAAPDVVSDVFLVAWRRIDDVPAEALPWLLVVARNTIGNGRRGRARQARLTDALACLERSSTAAPGAEDVALDRRAMLAALASLPPRSREALLLVSWDGLPLAQAAEVAECSRRAFEVRLHRARSRLREALAAFDEPTTTATAVPHLPPQNQESHR